MRRHWDDTDPRYDDGPRGSYGPRRRRGSWTVIGTPFGILGGGRRGYRPGYGGGYRRGYGGGGGGCARDACLLESGCCLAESLNDSCLVLTLLALPQILVALVRPGNAARTSAGCPDTEAAGSALGRGQRTLLAIIEVYQRRVSARRARPVCRYKPSCSAYTAQALSRYGVLRGAQLAAGRLLRCRPGVAGGADPLR